MKKLLTILMVIAVIGIVPAMANPTANSESTGGNNQKALNVNVVGSNVAASNINKELTNDGDLTNIVNNIAIGGNADADSANIGVASSGANSIAANGNDSQGESHALAKDNQATVTQTSAATAIAGSPEAYNYGDQTNDVVQDATATIVNTQDLAQLVDINEYQQSNGSDIAAVVVIGPFAENDSIAEGQPAVNTLPNMPNEIQG